MASQLKLSGPGPSGPLETIILKPNLPRAREEAVSAVAVSNFPVGVRVDLEANVAAASRSEKILNNFRAAKDSFRAKMLKKIREDHLNAYEQSMGYFPDSNIDKQSLKVKMVRFLRGNDFDRFYDQMSHVMAGMTENDLHSIAKGTPTRLAVQYLECIELLNMHGFYFVNGRNLNFWSGNNAEQQAKRDPDALNNSKIVATNVLFDLSDCVNDIEKANHEQILFTLFPQTICTALAAQAHGTVKVNISYDKETEKCRRGLIHNNIFWLAEMHTLRHLLERGVVRDIQFRFEGADGSFENNVVSIHNQEEFDQLAITRKFAYRNESRHPHLNDEADRFGPTNTPYPEWCRTARPREVVVSVGTMRAVMRGWNLNARSKRARRQAARIERAAIPQSVSATIIASNLTRVQGLV